MEHRDDHYRQFFPLPPDEPPERQSGGELLALLAVLSIVGAALWHFWGAPHLPQPLPTPAAIQSALASSALPYGAITFAGATLLWGLWLWTAGTLLLQLALELADATTRGARWVASVRAIADRVTLPLVRRAARHVVIATTVVQLAARTVLPAAAAPAPAHAIVTVTQMSLPTAARPATISVSGDGTVWHRVERGDNLWLLAERYYGDGEQWRRILAANVGRPMPGGATFPPTAEIQSGWLVRIPDPTAQSVMPAAARQMTYVVRQGDTLSAIALRSYGDAATWPRIFDANRGARLADGHVLTDPNLIWPGLALTIPGVAQPAAPAPSRPTVVPHTVPVTPTQRPSPPPPAAPAARAPTSVPSTAPPTPAATVLPAPIVTPAPPAAAAPTVVRPTTPAPVAFPTAGLPAAPATGSGDPAPLLGGGLAALATGGAILLARRRVRTSRAEPPPPADYRAGILLDSGFADAASAPTFARRLEGGREPAVLVAEQVLACLGAEADLRQVRLLAVHEGRHAMAVTLQAGLEEQGRLLAMAPDLAERLGARGAAARTPDHDVFLQLTDLTLLELAARPHGGPVAPVPLIALGISPRGEAVHANWELIGHTLIAGLPDSGADVVFTSLLAALAARHHPDHLALWTIAPHALFPPLLGDLPQQRRRVVDPADEAGVQTALAEVRTELERRMGASRSLDANMCRPDVVLAVHELADLPDDDGLLDLLGRYGPAHGVRLLATTYRPEAIADATLDYFRTRLVLRTADEAPSIRLLGQPDAADLNGGGDLFARLEGREPLRLRAFRIAPDYLVRLVDAMHAAFAGPPGRSASLSEIPQPAEGEHAPEPESPAQQCMATTSPEMVVSHLPAPSESPAYPQQVGSGGPPGLRSPLDPEYVPGRAPGRGGVAVATPPAVSAAPTAVEPPSSIPPAPLVLPIDAPVAPAPPAPAGARLIIRCFGDLEVLADGQPLTPGTNQRPWELLLYLALHPAGGVSRDTILATFWGEVDLEQATDRLNTALSRLRTLLARALPDLPSDVVRLERDGICHLDATLVWSDAQEFLARREATRRQPPAEAAATLEQVRELYRGEVFRQPAYAWLDEPGEDALTLRESFEETYALLSERLARLYTDLGQPAKAAPLYRELLRREPAIQQLAPALYRCYQALGDREGLLRAHQELDAALARNLRRAETTGEDGAAYRLAPTTVAAYEQAFAALAARGA